MTASGVQYFLLLVGFLVVSKASDEQRIQIDGPRFVIIGETATFFCTTTHNGSTTSNVYWHSTHDETKPQKLIQAKFKESLEMRNVQPSEAGKYICCRMGNCAAFMLYVLEFHDSLAFSNASSEFIALAVNRHKAISLTVNHGSFDVNLTLYSESDASKHIEKHSSIEYRTKYIIIAKTVEEAGWYRLNATTGDFSDNYRIHVSIDEPFVDLKHTNGSGIVVKNSGVVLQCAFGTSKVNDTFSVKLYFKSRVISQKTHNQTTINSIQHKIENITQHEAGVYRCCRMSNSSSNETCAVLNVFVLQIDHSISFQTNQEKAEGVIVTSPNLNTTVTVHYGSNEVYELSVHKGSDITSYELQKKKEDSQQKWMQYSFPSMQMNDSGWFTIKAICKGRVERYKLLVEVEGIPEPAIESPTVLANSDFLDFVCHGLSVPAPNIVEIQFTPCDLISSETPACKDQLGLTIKAAKVANETTGFNFREVGRIIGPFNSTGIIECRATNSKGTGVVKSALYPRFFLDEILLQILPNSDTTDQINRMIRCRVDIFNYTGNFVLQSNEENFNVTGYADKNTWVANVTIILNVPASRIVCNAQLKNGSFRTQSLDVTIDSNIYEIFEGENISSIKCSPNGSPGAEVSWYRNNIPCKLNPANTVLFPGENYVIFRCESVDKHEFISKSWKIQSRTHQIADKFDYKILLGILGIVFILLSLVITIKVIRSQATGDASNGYKLEEHVKNVMPSEYEFSRERLKFGRKLGEGEYGIVVLAQAEHILADEPLTTVAVKKLKHFKSESVMRMLVSELKVMVEVGQHLNVVNLLGAVTQSTRKQDFMIIMEYCECGNLLDFIRNNKSNFVDCKDDLGGGWAAQQIELSGRSRDESNAISFQTTDLIWWSAQIAYGMAYLASKNVLHGDLAARNVLLCERNVAKISDFGLARMMNREACYRKKSNEPLPIKWLAIESLSQNLFSVQSDVWAYGVVLWELFALGTSPYPSIDVNDLYDLLLRGYRMDKPDYATEDIYDIMTQCWFYNRKMRPTFDALAETFNQMMCPDLRRQYSAMNMPRLLANATTPGEPSLRNKLSTLPAWKYNF